ncbi:hypothetical protein M885DRAFT_511803 [Pelagophyceae sp. CCMP2097]|nr:hypothetical protein M885DRAFT_511803 [Pelagophyceae sp. CCMP2097]
MPVRLQMLLSPAKTLNFEPCPACDAAGPRTVPAGRAEANGLAAVLARLSAAQLKAALGVSDSLAAENFRRFQGWASAPERQAVVAYDGMAYAKLEARTLSTADLEWAHLRLVIPSGMWGPLRPFDAIKPYRLEMACKALAAPHKNLAAFWRETTTRVLLDAFEPGPGNLLVNCASDEYSAAVDWQALSSANVPVVKIDFHQGGRRAAAIHLKHGRGLMVRYIIRNRCDDAEALQGFDAEGYCFCAAKSDAAILVFERAAAPAVKKKASAAKKAPAAKKEVPVAKKRKAAA